MTSGCYPSRDARSLRRQGREFRIEILAPDKLDIGLDGVDVRGDELAGFDHVAVLEHHAGRAAVTVRVPMAFAKRGGRKLVISPDGVSTVASSRPRVDNTMVKALARAFRWRKLLETGVFATVEEIAVTEKINASYVGRVLRLTLLAPDIVEVILDGRQPAEMTLTVLMRPFPVVWREQQVAIGCCPDTPRSD